VVVSFFVELNKTEKASRAPAQKIKKGTNWRPSQKKNKVGLFLTATIFILEFTHTTCGIEYFLLASIDGTGSRLRH